MGTNFNTLMVGGYNQTNHAGLDINHIIPRISKNLSYPSILLLWYFLLFQVVHFFCHSVIFPPNVIVPACVSVLDLEFLSCSHRFFRILSEIFLYCADFLSMIRIEHWTPALI